MSSPIVLHLNDKGRNINGLSAADQLRQLRDEVEALQRSLATAREEIGMLAAERDELLDALREWAHATPEERMELLVDHELAVLRHELARLKHEPAPVGKEKRTARRAAQGRRCA